MIPKAIQAVVGLIYGLRLLFADWSLDRCVLIILIRLVHIYPTIWWRRGTPSDGRREQRIIQTFSFRRLLGRCCKPNVTSIWVSCVIRWRRRFSRGRWFPESQRRNCPISTNWSAWPVCPAFQPKWARSSSIFWILSAHLILRPDILFIALPLWNRLPRNAAGS